MSTTSPSKTHTPKPWKVVKPQHGRPSQYRCVQIGSNELYTTLEVLPADARLIAAAPNLLAACRDAIDFIELNHPETNIARDLREVVSKAEGAA